jgi:hypothetical protein
MEDDTTKLDAYTQVETQESIQFPEFIGNRYVRARQAAPALDIFQLLCRKIHVAHQKLSNKAI